MQKPDLTRVAKVRISVLLPGGKRWEIVPVDEQDVTDAVLLVSRILERAKIDGPYSAGVDPVKIAGLPGND